MNTLTKNETISAIAIPTDAIKPEHFLLRVLSNKWTPLAVVAFFISALLVWSYLDHSYPVHDAAWHSHFSSNVKRWLCRPRNWSIPTLLELIRQQPLYPAGVWFLNGAGKLIVGDSRWSEQLLQVGYLIVLSFSTYVTAAIYLKDKAKATMSVLLVNCCPLIQALSHTPYLDLPHTALYAAWLASVAWWDNTNPTWKKTLLCGALLGLYCTTKQIAVAYCAPLLLFLLIHSVVKKNHSKAIKVTAMSSFAPLALLAWFVPNSAALLDYLHARTSLSSATGNYKVDLLPKLVSNEGIIFAQIIQSFSLLASMALLASFRSVGKSDLKKLSPIFFSSILASVAIGLVLFHNTPEHRYFAPILVPLSLVLASALVNASRKSSKWIFATCALMLLLIGQFLFTNFSSIDVRCIGPQQNPTWAVLGVDNQFFHSKLSYYPAGDPWQQEWVFNHIESKEFGRPSWLNVLPNTTEFNQGTLAAIARQRASDIYPMCWRACQSNNSDTFNYTPNDLRSIHWFLHKTGTLSNLANEASQKKYDDLLAYLEQSGNYIKESRPLPDGSSVVLYRNKNLMLPPGQERLFERPKKK